MNIFPQEKEDDLSDLLSAKSSIVYASLAEKSQCPEVKKQIKENKAFAGIEDSDLYYTQSILVTTSWNKNDDIFDPKEVWLAKDTPMHKPTNLEHDESLIVGHITSNWPINDDGDLIEENMDENNLPEKFHILTGSVIYKGYTDPELRQRSEKLIAEIESGDKYVSMECFFKGFDYGLVDKATGKFNILPRNEETAFLTKHLRAYGGQGEHQEYKIGRVLRQITFSGKGFVNKPANPESIIFTKDNLHFDKQIASDKNNIEKKDNFEEVGVFSNQANLKEIIMSLKANQTTEITEQKTETVSITATDIVDPTNDSDNQALLNAQAELEALKVEKEEAAKKMNDEMKKKQEEMQKLKAELDATNEILAAYKDKEAEMMKKEKKMKRMASLIEKGFEEAVAMQTVEKFESLDDTVFESLISVIAAMNPTKTVKKEDTKAEESVDVSEALENVETDQSVDLSVGADNLEDSELQNTRAALVDFVCIRLGKNLKKGE